MTYKAGTGYYADDEWHTLSLLCWEGYEFCTTIIDGERGEDGFVNQSGFNWASIIKVGYSEHVPDFLFVGQMKDITYQSVYRANGTLIYESPPKDET